VNIQPLHPNFILPTTGSAYAGAYDIYMPTDGVLYSKADKALPVPLGFAAEVPTGYVALLLPRSGAGAKKGLALNNTCGLIDSDYRGEWVAYLRVHDAYPVRWEAGERLLQFLLVQSYKPLLEVVSELDSTDRGTGGFGSTGQ